LRKKQVLVLKTGFRSIASANVSTMQRTVMGLSVLNSFVYNRVVTEVAEFFNQLELLSLVYQLVFSRMRVLRWKEEPRFMSVQHLVSSYLQTLWMKNPEKYEYVQDLIEGNVHVYAVLLDDLVDWHYEHVRRKHLLYSFVKIKQFDKMQFKKLDKLIRILNKYNQKISKVHLLDFIGKVNKVRPRESLIYVLQSLFTYYSGLYKQEAFNKIKMNTIKLSIEEESKQKAIQLLGKLFNRRRHQVYNSMPYRTLFPLSEERDPTEAADILKNELNKLIKKRLCESFKKIHNQADDSMSLHLTSERQMVTTMEVRYNKLLLKHAELLSAVIQRKFTEELGFPFRQLLWYSFQQNDIRARLANDLYILFMKRYMAGFNQIRLEAEYVMNQKYITLREGFSILDMFSKNRLNTGKRE
jgi:hypothetical protein